MAHAALLAGAGRPTMPGAPVKYTIPWSLKTTAATQLTKQSISGLNNGGGVTTDATSPVTGGQASWCRFASVGAGGTQWYLNDITASPISLSGDKYWRYRGRLNKNAGNIARWFWRFADSKAAHDAGNYVTVTVAPTPSGTTSTANWLPDTTWVWDGFDPVNDGIVVGTGVTSWASVGYIAIQITAGTAGFTVDLAEVQVVTKATTKAKAVFWHDDTVLSGAQALATKLNTYGWKFCEANIWEKVGNTLALSASDMNTFAAAGDIFTTHAITDAEHIQQSAAQLTNQAIRSRNATRSRNVAGASPGDFTWWGGQSYAQVYLDVIRQFYRSGRGNTSSITMPEMIPPADPHIYKSVLTATTDTYAGLWKPAVDRAIATKGWVNFIYHQNLADAPGTNDSYKTDTDSLLAYLDANRSTIDVVTITDVMALCT